MHIKSSNFDKLILHPKHFLRTQKTFIILREHDFLISYNFLNGTKAHKSISIEDISIEDISIGML